MDEINSNFKQEEKLGLQIIFSSASRNFKAQFFGDTEAVAIVVEFNGRFYTGGRIIRPDG